MSGHSSRRNFSSLAGDGQGSAPVVDVRESEKITKNTMVNREAGDGGRLLLVEHVDHRQREQRQGDQAQTDRNFNTAKMRKFSGTFHSRFSGCLNRSTRTERALNEKLQTTPKAYASPSRFTSPRLSRMVTICRIRRY